MPRKLTYNDASQELRFEFPDNWLTASGVNIQIVNLAGTDLLAATAATVYTATTTDGTVAAGDSTFTVDGTDAMEAGDRFRISKSRDTTEIVTVLSQAAKVSTIEHTFDFAHADESAVSAMWCTYALDTSTVATWTKGLECQVIWIPNTDDEPFVEPAVIYAYDGADVAGWQDAYRARYPNAYRMAADRLDTLYEHAKLDLAWHVRAIGKDLTNLRDNELIPLCLFPIMTKYIYLDSGEMGQDEVDQAEKDRQYYLDMLSRPAIWFDTDQDTADGEGEKGPIEWTPMGPGRFGRW